MNLTGWQFNLSGSQNLADRGVDIGSKASGHV